VLLGVTLEGPEEVAFLLLEAQEGEEGTY